MKTFIEIALAGIAGYCFVNWAVILYYWVTGKIITENEYAAFNEQAFKYGLCGILALGFLGVML